MEKRDDPIRKLLQEAYGVSDEQFLREMDRIEPLIPDKLFTVCKEEREAILEKLYRDKVIYSFKV